MLGPNQHTFQLANHSYDERAMHSARINAIKRDRNDGEKPFHAEGHRLLTVRRLAAAGVAGFLLTAAITAGGASLVAASPSHASGAGAVLVR